MSPPRMPADPCIPVQATVVLTSLLTGALTSQSCEVRYASHGMCARSRRSVSRSQPVSYSACSANSAQLGGHSRVELADSRILVLVVVVIAQVIPLGVVDCALAPRARAPLGLLRLGRQEDAGVDALVHEPAEDLLYLGLQQRDHRRREHRRDRVRRWPGLGLVLVARVLEFPLGELVEVGHVPQSSLTAEIALVGRALLHHHAVPAHLDHQIEEERTLALVVPDGTRAI
mmetsp:Transcript_54367/g.140434  ORF Transcript_54367/g.140434 Transcript_54367/m.140434 type:complete len:230 (+) Transcript_54367:166-855(+)